MDKNKTNKGGGGGWKDFTLRGNRKDWLRKIWAYEETEATHNNASQ